jgi:hypothetical protein
MSHITSLTTNGLDCVVSNSMEVEDIALDKGIVIAVLVQSIRDVN